MGWVINLLAVIGIFTIIAYFMPPSGLDSVNLNPFCESNWLPLSSFNNNDKEVRNTCKQICELTYDTRKIKLEGNTGFNGKEYFVCYCDINC